MPIKAGELDRRITIERAAATQDPGSGHDIQSWATLATVWAKVTPVSDRERVASAQVSAEITDRFLIRWSPQVSGVSPKDRIVYGGRTYNISGVKEIDRRVGIEITAAARPDL
jgi:SPP1 family predicted phage head-tail adaptor